jgi:uncharacterized membrane protein (UPF0127 family)
MDYLVIDDKTIGTIVAVTEQDHIRGLMFQPWPPPIMAFPYKKAEVRKFWMKNTISPLDIIFCRAGRVVAIVAGKPHSELHVGPNEPTDLVVEMPFGMAKTLNIVAGSSIKLRASLNTIAAQYYDHLKQVF